MHWYNGTFINHDVFDPLMFYKYYLNTSHDILIWYGIVIIFQL